MNLRFRNSLRHSLITLGDVVEQATDVLAAIGEPAIPALIDEMAIAERYHALAIGDALSRIGEPAVPVLVEALSDKLNEEFREYAARALNLMGVAAISAIPALIETLTDPSDEVRSYAAYTFSKMEGAAAEAVPALIKALADESEEVRNHVAFAFRKNWDPGSETGT